jgi:DNA-binding CsgD family transcriptional regulator
LSARSMGQYPLALSGLNFTSAQNRRRAAETPEVDKCDLSNGGFRSLNWVLTHAPRSTERSQSISLDRLTGRQREILNQLSRGSTNAQIATALDISPETVRKHVENILLRLGLPTRTAAAVFYITGSSPAISQPWTAYVASMHGHLTGSSSPELPGRRQNQRSRR